MPTSFYDLAIPCLHFHCLNISPFETTFEWVISLRFPKTEKQLPFVSNFSKKKVHPGRHISKLYVVSFLWPLLGSLQHIFHTFPPNCFDYVEPIALIWDKHFHWGLLPAEQIFPMKNIVLIPIARVIWCDKFSCVLG